MANEVDNIQALYNTVSKDFNVGTYDQFNEKLQDSENRKSIYDLMSKKYNVGTFDDFEGRIVKKKDISNGQELPTQEDTSLSQDKSTDLILPEVDFNKDFQIEHPQTSLSFMVGTGMQQSLLADGILYLTDLAEKKSFKEALKEYRSQKEAMKDVTSQYKNNMIEEAGAFALGMFFDMPLFGGMARIGKEAVKPLISGGEYLYKTLLKKGATELAAEEITTSAIKKMIPKVIESVSSGGAALGGYNTLTDINRQLEEGASFKDINWSESLKEGERGFVLGGSLGILGFGSKVAENAITRNLQNNIGKLSTKLGIETAEFAGVNAVFTYGNNALRGKPLKDVTGEEYLRSGLMLGALKLSGALTTSKIFTKEKTNTGIFKVDFTEDDINSVSKSLGRDIKDVTDISDVELDKINNDEKVPIITKQKVLWSLQGVKAEVDKIPTEVKSEVKKDKVVNKYLNKDGDLIYQKSYEDKTEATNDAIKVSENIKEEQNKERIASLKPEEIVDVNDELELSGMNMKDFSNSSQKPLSERTTDDRKIISKVNNVVKTYLADKTKAEINNEPENTKEEDYEEMVIKYGQKQSDEIMSLINSQKEKYTIPASEHEKLRKAGKLKTEENEKEKTEVTEAAPKKGQQVQEVNKPEQVIKKPTEEKPKEITPKGIEPKPELNINKGVIIGNREIYGNDITKNNPELDFLNKELPKKKPNKKDRIDISDLQGEVNIKPIELKTKSQSTDELLSIATAKDDMRPIMNGIYYDAEKNVKIASDANVLVSIPEKIKGKSRIINPKTGEIIEGKYPNYNSVIPDNENISPINIKELNNVVNGVERASEFVDVGFSNNIGIQVRMIYDGNEIFFSPYNLNKGIKPLINSGTKNARIEFPERNDKAIIIRDVDNPRKFSLVMPIMPKYDGVKTTILDVNTNVDKNLIKEVINKLQEPSWGEKYHQEKLNDETETMKDYHQENFDKSKKERLDKIEYYKNRLQETELETQENDTQNKTRLPGEVGIGQEPIEGQPNEITGRETSERNRVLQTQEKEIKPQENVTGKETTGTPSVEEVRNAQQQGGEEVNLRKEKAKQQIQSGIDGLIEKFGGKQNLTSEEKTTLIEDLSNIAKGITDLSVEEIKAFIKEKIKPLIAKLGLKDEEIDDIVSRAIIPAGETGIRMESTEQTRKEFALGDYERPKTLQNDELNIRAEEEIKKGFNIEGLINEIKDGKLPNDLEQRILGRYISGLERQLELNTSNENISKLKTAVDASDIAGTKLSASFRSRQGEGIRDDSMAGFFMEDMDNLGIDVLTPLQKKTIQKEWDEINGLKKQYEDKLLQLSKDEARQKANKEFEKQRKATPKVKRTHEEYVAERKLILGDIAAAWKKASTDGVMMAAPFPYAKQMAYITPHVLRLMKSYLKEGIDNLEAMVGNIHKEVSEIIPDITEKDVHNIIAGEYTKPTKTRTELATRMQDLRSEAKLINKYEELEKGIEPKIERKKILRNQKLTELRKQIREHDLTKLAQAKSRMQSEIDRIQEDLRTGKFAKEKVVNEIKLDKEALEIKDKLIRSRQDRRVRMLQEKYANRNDLQIAGDLAIEIMNTSRAIMTSGDLSAVFRQGLIPTIAHPIMAAEYFGKMLKQAVSQKSFDRWLYDVHNSPDYAIMKESGLYVSDPINPDLTAKEEVYMNNLAEKIPVIGKYLIKPSERAYISYLNQFRVGLFRRASEFYQSEGKTFYNNPKLYKETANLINNELGRGNLGRLEGLAKYLNTPLFAPRLIASRFNLLTNIINPRFYLQVPKEVRVEYFKDMAKFVGFGVSILALAKLSGAEVETDWRSTDFGKIKIGDQRWDIWGGFQPYVRLIGQFIMGATKSPTTGKLSKLGSGFNEKNRLELVGHFLRGKLSPVAATLTDVVTGKTYMGENTTVSLELQKNLLPLMTNDIMDAVKDKGISGILTVGIPSILGMGVQNFPVTGAHAKSTLPAFMPEGDFVKYNGIKINALGEKESEIDYKAWTVLTENKFNIQPKTKSDLENYNVKGKPQKYTTEQYVKYLKARGEYIKEGVTNYVEPDRHDVINSLRESGQEFKNEEQINKIADKIIEDNRFNFFKSLKERADRMGEYEATGMAGKPSKVEQLINK